MTPDAYETLIFEAKNPRQIVSAFTGMENKTRRSLSKTARTLNRQLRRFEAGADASDRVKAIIKEHEKKPWQDHHRKLYEHTVLGLFAVAPFSTLKNVDIPYDKISEVRTILEDRHPDWLQDWVHFQTDREWSPLPYGFVRTLINKGLIEAPNTDGWAQCLAREGNAYYGMGAYQRHTTFPLSQRWRKDRVLQAGTWLLFERSTDAFTSNKWNFEHAEKDGKKHLYEPWAEGLLTLEAAGEIDRNRLLDASLSALWTEQPRPQYGGLAKLHKDLKPSLKDCEVREGDYRALLAHTETAVVKFALERLKLLAQKSKLDVAAFLPETQNILFAPAKGNAVQTLRLLKTLLAKNPKAQADILLSVADGLQHPHTDVQSMAVDILSAQKELPASVTQKLTELSGFVNATVQVRLRDLTGFEPDEVDNIASIPLSELLAKVSEEEKHALALDKLSAPDSSPYVPINSDIMMQHIAPLSVPLSMPQSVNEVLDLIAFHIEDVDSPDQIEMMIAGMAAITPSYDKTFSQKAAPLLTRLEKGGGSKGLTALAGGVGSRLEELVHSWLRGRTMHVKDGLWVQKYPALHPIRLWLKDINKSVGSRKATTLLATPTHEGGWIEPSLWVARVLHKQEVKDPINDLDFKLSLLRLMPDGRLKALEAAKDIKGSYGQIAQFALGAHKRPGLMPRQKGAWLTAARARDPKRDFSDHFPRSFKGFRERSGALTPVKYAWQDYDKTKLWHLGFVSNAADPGKPVPAYRQGPAAVALRAARERLVTHMSDTPAAVLNVTQHSEGWWNSELTQNWLVTWMVQLWPTNPDAVLMSGLLRMWRRKDDGSNGWQPMHGFLEALFHPRRVWGRTAHVMAALGLVSKDADVRGLSVDAMIEGISHGVVDANQLSSDLSRLFATGQIKVNRLSDSLPPIINASPLHAYVVGEILSGWLPKTDLKQRGMFTPLEALLECLSMTRQGLSPDMKEALSSLKGSSKAAKTAKALLALKQDDMSMLDQIRALAIEGRLL